jgi:hypothetical protein
MRAAALFLLLLVGLAAPVTGQQLQPGLEVRVTRRAGCRQGRGTQ